MFHSHFSCEGLSFFLRNYPLVFKIRFVSSNHKRHCFRVTVFHSHNVFTEPLDSLKSLLQCHSININKAITSSHILISNIQTQDQKEDGRKNVAHTALKSSWPAVSKISVKTSRPSTVNCFRYVAKDFEDKFFQFGPITC